MKKSLKITAILLILCIALCSCGKGEEYSFDYGLDKYGYFEGIKAMDEVTLGDFDKIVLDQSQIDAAIEELCYEYGTETEATNRAVEKDDRFYMDYLGRIDGEAFDGGTATNQQGDLKYNGYIPGLLEGCIGHYPGETFDVAVTFPEDYGVASLNGKDAVFTITITSVVDVTPAEFTDDFVYSYFAYYGYETAQDLIDFFQLQLLNQYIVDNSTVNSIPETVMKWSQGVSVRINQLTAKNYYQIEEVKYLQDYYGVESEEEYLVIYSDQITEEAETALVYQALAEHENIKLSDDDLKTYVTNQGGGDTYDQYVDTFGIKYYKLIVMEDVIVDKLMEKAVFE